MDEKVSLDGVPSKRFMGQPVAGRGRFDNRGVGLYSACPVDSAKAVDIAINLAALLFAISFHESAHAWMAWRWGDSTAKDLGRISMNPIRHIDLFGSIILPALLYFTSGMLFGYAKPTPVRLENTRDPRRADRWISGAGPVSNLVLAAAGVLVLLLLRIATGGAAFTNAGGAILTPVVIVLFTFVRINIVLGVFNLIPIPPLDGSWVLSSLFPALRRVFETIAPFGFLILIVLSSTRILSWILGPPLELLFGVVNRVLRVA
jgi:Zn-dependent protease